MLLPVLVALLAIPSANSAVKMADCTKSKKGIVPTLDAVRACQKRERNLIINAFEKQKKGAAPIWLLEKIDDHEREEVRNFLQKYPNRATLSTLEAPSKSTKTKGNDFMNSVKSYFKDASVKLKSMMGMGAASKKRIGNPTAAELEASRSLKTVTDMAEKNGLDLEKHKRDSLLNPGKSLQKRVDKYHKSLKTNLDPSMKKFYRKGKKKKKK